MESTNFIPQQSGGPLSPQILNSQQLQAQLMASFQQQDQSGSLWNEKKGNSLSCQGSVVAKSFDKTRNNLNLPAMDSNQQLLQLLDTSQTSNKQGTANEISLNPEYLSLNAGQTGSIQHSVGEPSHIDFNQPNVLTSGSSSCSLSVTKRHIQEKGTQKSKLQMTRPKMSKKGQKIKHLLSERVNQHLDSTAVDVGKVNDQSILNMNNCIPSNSEVAISSVDTTSVTLAKPELFASNLMRKVIIQDWLSNNPPGRTKLKSLLPKPAVTHLISGTSSTGISSATASGNSQAGFLSDTNSTPLMLDNITSLPSASPGGLTISETSHIRLQSVQSLSQFLPRETTTNRNSVSTFPYSTSLQSNPSAVLDNRSACMQSVTGLSQVAGTSTSGTSISQLSPGSLSMVTSLLGPLMNHDSREKPGEQLDGGEQLSTSGSDLTSNEMILSEESSVLSKNTTHQDQHDLPAVQSKQSGALQPDSVKSLLQKSLLTQGQPAVPQGSILIPLNQGGTGSTEHVAVTYQQLQSALSSLISGLQGQLDAAQKLVPPVMATSVQNLSHTKQVETSLNQSIQDLASSNQLTEIPYPVVQFPINTGDQLNCNPVENSTILTNGETDQNLILESRSEQLVNLQNRTERDQLNGGMVDSLSEGNPLFMMNVGDRLVGDSFLTEQPEHIYDDQNFLYNKGNMDSYLSSRGSNSVSMETIDQGIMSSQVPVEIQVDCENIQDQNASKTHLMLSHDPEEDITDVPNIFKKYCLLCKAAMLEGECQFHKHDKMSYNHIKDTPILSRARTSIPSCLALQPTSTFGNYNVYLGVWTKENIPAQTKFGPLVGKVTQESEKKDGSAPCFPRWKIFLETRSERVDMCDENECNWMMFIKPARCEQTQNMIAHQLGRHIYFFTTKEVFHGQELLYWFSKEYATLSGLPLLPSEAFLSECLICGKVFINKTTRKLHMKEHPHYQKYKCHICDHLYSSLSSLNRHTMIHMGVKPHICHVCHKTFVDNSNLQVHLKVHEGVRLFSCDVCQKTFRQKAHLKTHLLIHTGQKNLRCYFCDKKFAREGDRKQHEYQHTNEKSFKCEQCGREFFKLQNYKRHLKIHAGIRDFECQFCMKTFGRKFHLQRHMEKCQVRNVIFEEKDLVLNNVDLKGILNS